MLSIIFEHSVVLLIAAIVVSTFALYPHFRVRRVLHSFPLARKELGSAHARRNEFLKDPMKAYREGHERFRGKTFRVTHYEGKFSNYIGIYCWIEDHVISALSIRFW